MGTTFSIVLYASCDSIARSASAEAFARVEELNGILSDYEYDSELNRLSRRSGTDRGVRVSPPLFRVISKAQQVARKTGGAFDITVGPYVQLWRRMNREPAPELPHPDTLKKNSRAVGFRHVRIDSSSRTVRLTKPGMQLDPGGIAKGYAADEALNVLEQHGIGAALIDAGGDVVLGAPPPGSEGWRVTLLMHTGRGDPQTMTLQLANRAVATSGDLFQHVVIDGKRYSHIIDPRTGLGLTNRRLVSIIAPDGITADSYASAVSVLGPEKGLALITGRDDLSGYIEYRTDDRIARRFSPEFEEYIIQK